MSGAFFNPQAPQGTGDPVDNLDPALLRGVESQGMLLAASDEKGHSIIMPDRAVTPGSIVK